MDKNLKALIDAYLAENLVEEDIPLPKKTKKEITLFEDKVLHSAMRFYLPSAHYSCRRIKPPDLTKIIDTAIEENKGETFSEMLLRLIKESGEAYPAVYNRAKIDRRIFHRIKKNRNYNAKKDTVISFAFALKLNLEKTKKLLDVAGYTLTKSKRDLIITVLIEQKIFDIDSLNDALYEYNQDVLFKKK